MLFLSNKTDNDTWAHAPHVKLRIKTRKRAHRKRLAYVYKLG